MKNTLDGGEAILEACRKLNVDYIVSSPGTEWAPVWEAMANQMKNGKNGPGFLYNPVLQALGAARDYNLPTVTVIFNNKKYSAMQGMHLKMYPDGIAVDTDTFHDTHINALRNGLRAADQGRSAIIDVIVSR